MLDSLLGFYLKIKRITKEISIYNFGVCSCKLDRRRLRRRPRYLRVHCCCLNNSNEKDVLNIVAAAAAAGVAADDAVMNR